MGFLSVAVEVEVGLGKAVVMRPLVARRLVMAEEEGMEFCGVETIMVAAVVAAVLMEFKESGALAAGEMVLNYMLPQSRDH